ncbi:hypothetical protein ACH9DO_05690 [Kocuria sp. M1N1S27]|uniref:hypothetical protein n=1 Tax=Kocuria kalidii TaxID=3376283 RepID=UPI0037A168E1
MPARRVPGLGVLSLGLLAGDALVLTAHRLHHGVRRIDPDERWPLPFRSHAVWNGGADGSLVELWGLLQLGVAAVLLLLLARRAPGRRVLAVWGAALLVMVADDLLRLHERAGAILGLERWDSALSAAGGQELGGLVFWAVVGTVLGAALVRAYTTSVAPARRAALLLLAATAPFGAVAVGYVLLSAFGDGALDGLAGLVLVDVRVTVKLLTTTACLVLALRWTGVPLLLGRPLTPPAAPPRPDAGPRPGGSTTR